MLKTLSSLISACFFFAVIAFVLIISSLWEYAEQLPDYHQLAKYEPAVTTRLYAGNGQLLKEYASEKRLFVPVSKMPERLKQAFISAEDKNFYHHSGVDIFGIIRAIISNIQNIGSGRRPAGASTITQQVAKNFLLSSELSYTRKIKEAILAMRMEQAFTKEHILELYLNEIYLGNRSYGVAAAALNYFGKPLDELEIEEMAYLAALPKGPNNYHPIKKYDAAVARRNWVIDRMFEEGYITEEEAEIAKSKPLKTINRNKQFIDDAEYFSEEVRREVSEKFGKEALYEGGLIIRTTVDPKLQKIATKVFRQGIEEYDIKHGYRGALKNIDINADYMEELQKIDMPKGAKENWQLAIVLSSDVNKAIIKTQDGKEGEIPLSLVKWARKTLKNQGITDEPNSVAKVLQAGDVVLVEAVSEQKQKSNNLGENSYYLRQIPNVEGALVALAPHTGKVLAAVGGYDFEKSQYNRATQAYRQTGSAFKPIVYLAALENGYSPNDLILDAPFILDQGPGKPKWKPDNYSKKFYGLMTLRQGIEKSKNLMTVRLAQDLGMDKVSEYAKKLGVNDNLPHLLSMSLGAGETRVIDLAKAYAVIVNGGKNIQPYFIEQIQDRYGRDILKQDKRACLDCNVDAWGEGKEIPQLEDVREQIVDPLSAYQMTSILEGVAVRGTGARLRSIKHHLGGKTGTSNDSQDAWFVGFSPDLVVAVYIGFDSPRTLGRYETGASAALPIFKNFMEEALKNQPDIPFRIPTGIKLVRINYDTGRPATPQDTTVIIEALKPDYSFDQQKQRVINGQSAGEDDAQTPPQDDAYQTSEDSDFMMGTEY